MPNVPKTCAQAVPDKNRVFWDRLLLDMCYEKGQAFVRDLPGPELSVRRGSLSSVRMGMHPGPVCAPSPANCGVGASLSVFSEKALSKIARRRHATRRVSTTGDGRCRCRKLKAAYLDRCVHGRSI